MEPIQIWKRNWMVVNMLNIPSQLVYFAVLARFLLEKKKIVILSEYIYGFNNIFTTVLIKKEFVNLSKINLHHLNPDVCRLSQEVTATQFSLFRYATKAKR